MTETSERAGGNPGMNGVAVEGDDEDKPCYRPVDIEAVCGISLL